LDFEGGDEELKLALRTENSILVAIIRFQLSVERGGRGAEARAKNRELEPKTENWELKTEN
jgi:hypothetical protein